MFRVTDFAAMAALPAAESPALGGSRNGTGGAKSSTGLIGPDAIANCFETGNSGRDSKLGLTGSVGVIPAAILAVGNFTSGKRVAGLVKDGATTDLASTSRGTLRAVSGVGNGGAMDRGMAGFDSALPKTRLRS